MAARMRNALPEDNFANYSIQNLNLFKINPLDFNEDAFEPNCDNMFNQKNKLSLGRLSIEIDLMLELMH